MDALSPNIADKVRTSFAKQSFMTSAKAQLDVVEAGKVVISAPVLDGFKQQHGYSHAGLIFSLGDSAAGYAALSVMPEDMEVLTVEMKINLLSPGQGNLTAEGRVLKAGKRLVVVASEVWGDGQGGKRALVASLQGTMIPISM